MRRGVCWRLQHFAGRRPVVRDINSGQTASGPEHVIVKLNPDVVSTVADYGQPSFVGAFADKRPPPDILFGVGDVLTITIFEAAAGGLFIPAEAGVRPGNFVTLPNEPIDSAGNISVPYAGAVKAAGRTQGQVQKEIVDALKNRAIEPQVVVALATQNTSLISVLGEVNTPNRFAAFPAGEHLLDAITRAGGIKGQGWDTVVELERDGKRAIAPFASLVYDPRNNIWAHPNDTIYVFREPQTFLAFGAAGQQGQFAFDDWKISLAEAVGKAGGLLDVQADPASVYVYRREPRDLVAKLGVDVSPFDRPDSPGHLRGQLPRRGRLLPRDEVRNARQGRPVRGERAVGRDDEVPQLPEHRQHDRLQWRADRQRTADACGRKSRTTSRRRDADPQDERQACVVSLVGRGRAGAAAVSAPTTSASSRCGAARSASRLSSATPAIGKNRGRTRHRHSGDRCDRRLGRRRAIAARDVARAGVSPAPIWSEASALLKVAIAPCGGGGGEPADVCRLGPFIADVAGVDRSRSSCARDESSPSGC